MNLSFPVMLGLSHPSRVRGLKPGTLSNEIVPINVAPFTGAWIETCIGVYYPAMIFGRTLHGCVD